MGCCAGCGPGRGGMRRWQSKVCDLHLRDVYVRRGVGGLGCRGGPWLWAHLHVLLRSSALVLRCQHLPLSRLHSRFPSPAFLGAASPGRLGSPRTCLRVLTPVRRCVPAACPWARCSLSSSSSHTRSPSLACILGRHMPVHICTHMSPAHTPLRYVPGLPSLCTACHVLSHALSSHAAMQ